MSYISTLLVAGFLAATGPAMAQDLPDPDSPAYRELPLMIEETGTIYQKVVARTVETKRGKTMDGSGETQYSQHYTYNDEGYTVFKKLISFKVLSNSQPEAAGAEAQAALLKMATTIGDVTYIADQSLSPLRIEDWPSVLANIKSAMGSMFTDDGEPELADNANKMIDSLFGNLTPEEAVGVFLPVDNMITMPHNIGLELNKPLIVESQVIIPFGNYPLDATEKMELSLYDEASNTARVTYLYAPKPESFSAFLIEFMPKVMTQMGAPEDAIKATTAEFTTADPSKFVDLTTRCDYEIAIDTGLVRKGICTKTTRITMSIESLTKIESWEFSESFTPFN